MVKQCIKTSLKEIDHDDFLELHNIMCDQIAYHAKMMKDKMHMYHALKQHDDKKFDMTLTLLHFNSACC